MSSSDLLWFYLKNNKEYGPFSSRDIKNLVAKEELLAHDLIKYGKSGQWKKANSIKGLIFPVQKRELDLEWMLDPHLPVQEVPRVSDLNCTRPFSFIRKIQHLYLDFSFDKYLDFSFDKSLASYLIKSLFFFSTWGVIILTILIQLGIIVLYNIGFYVNTVPQTKIIVVASCLFIDICTILTMIAFLFVLRVVSEFVITSFKIAEHLRDLRDLKND